MTNWKTFCDGEPTLFGMFDFSFAPQLLFYAYIPIILIALLLATVIFLHRNNFKTPNILFFNLAIVFSLYLINDVFMWIAVPAAVNMFSWQIFILLRLLILILLVAFMYTQVFQKSLPSNIVIPIIVLSLPIVLLLASPLNIIEFDSINCEGHSGILLWYLYSLEIFASLTISYLAFKVIKNSKDKIKKTNTTLLWIACLFFIFFLTSADYLGEVSGNFEINFIGPVGVLLFLCIIAYMIVKYQTFNIKIFGAQALVISLWFLIGSLLFVVVSTTVFVIVCTTFILTIVFGINLIRSVRYEVEARRMLAEANAGQERFIHFLGHEVKGFFTVARNGYASILEGDFGHVPEPLSQMAQNALARMNTGVTIVEGVLKSANLKSGKVIFKFSNFNLSDAIRKRVELAKSLLEERGLVFDLHVPETPCTIEADEEHITNHVLKNLIENSIYYTPSGSIGISLTRKPNSYLVAIKDTGVGITEEDKKRLFTEGGQGAESTKINVHSTGHGLFIVKNIVVAHKGRVWAESEGAGKGSTFFLELPITQKTSR